MPKPFLSIEEINSQLSRVKIRVKGNKLYLRATLPIKTGEGHKQQDIRTQLNNTTDELYIAFMRAKRLESDLHLQKFQWSDWVDIPSEKGMTCREAVVKFEQFFWETRKRTKSREQDFVNVYYRFLKVLPPDALLSGEVLRECLVKYEVDSYYRNRCYMVYTSLANWAGISLPRDWKFLKGKYNPKRDRIIPTDNEIEMIWDGIKNLDWRWCFGVLAIYGIRPHELFYFDLKYDERINNLIGIIGETTKTNARVAYPLFPVGSDWVREWGYLKDDEIVKRFPNFTTDITNRTNKELGGKIAQRFNSSTIGFEAYSLRDRYALRAIELDIDSIVVAQWMGHSLEVHARDYTVYLNERVMSKVWLGKNQGSNKKEP